MDDVLLSDEEPYENVSRFLDERVYEYNVAATGVSDGRLFAIVVRDERGDVVAGLSGSMWGGCLEIANLWVREDQRGKGNGTRLLEAAERDARARGCRLAVLDTHSFQAPAFYQKRGYIVYGVLDDYPAGHRKLHLKKSLR